MRLFPYSQEYSFFAPEPPEELRKQLEAWVENDNVELAHWREAPDDNILWKAGWQIKWKGDRFLLQLSYSQKTSNNISGAAGSVTKRGAGVSFAAGRQFLWEKRKGYPFDGRIEPGATGGSVLRGRFRLLSGTLAYGVCFPILLVVLLFLWKASFVTIASFVALAGAVEVRQLWRSWRRLDQDETVLAVIRFLRRHLG